MGSSPIHPFKLPSLQQPPHLPSAPTVASAAKSKMMRAPVRIGAGALIAVLGYGLIKDTVSGTNMKRQDAIAAVKGRAEWQDTEYGWGKWSGMPWMDKMAHSVKRLMLFGPWNLRVKWETSTINFNSWVNDVLLPNAVPIGLMTGGVLGMVGFGRMHAGTKAAGKFFKNYVHVPASFKTGMKLVAQKTAQGTGKGIGKAMSWPLKTPAHALVTLGGVLLGSFAVSRFNDVYEQDAQHNYFRDLSNTKGS